MSGPDYRVERYIGAEWQALAGMHSEAEAWALVQQNCPARAERADGRAGMSSRRQGCYRWRLV